LPAEAILGVGFDASPAAGRIGARRQQIKTGRTAAFAFHPAAAIANDAVVGLAG
jgi:hypothetical protein